MYLNKVMVFGNLTRDPELRSTPGGQQVCSFGLATNRTFKKQDGSKGEQTEFHNIVVWGRQGETCAQYLKKGSSAYVEGRLQTRTWETPEKGKQYKTEIIAERVQFGPRSSGAGDASSRRPAGAASGQQDGVSDTEAPQQAPKEAIDYPEEDINPDDIPF